MTAASLREVRSGSERDMPWCALRSGTGSSARPVQPAVIGRHVGQKRRHRLPPAYYRSSNTRLSGTVKLSATPKNLTDVSPKCAFSGVELASCVCRNATCPRPVRRHTLAATQADGGVARRIAGCPDEKRFDPVSLEKDQRKRFSCTP